MLTMEIRLEGDGAFSDLDAFEIIHLADSSVIRVAALKGGMASGAASVAFGFPLPDGKYVIAETSLALFLTAADSFRQRYGDPRIKIRPSTPGEFL